MTERRSVIPDSPLAAIGHVANTMATLEFYVDVGIWELVGALQQLTACLTAQMISVHPKLKAFIGLVEVLGGSKETIGKLKTIQGRIAGLAEDRNRMVHDPRMVHQRTGETSRLQITAKPTVHFGFLTESEVAVTKVANAIGQQLREFSELRDAAIAEIRALPEESRPELVQIISAQEQSTPPKTS
jgi:hypothetical protein